MKRLIVKWFSMSLAIIATSFLLRGIVVANIFTAVIVALFLGLVNTFLRPLLVILTFPITILTLGLFLLIINAFLLQFVSFFVNGFFVISFGWAIIGSIMISILNSAIYHIMHDNKR